MDAWELGGRTNTNLKAVRSSQLVSGQRGLHSETPHLQNEIKQKREYHMPWEMKHKPSKKAHNIEQGVPE